MGGPSSNGGLANPVVVHVSATNCNTSGTSRTCVINPITSGNKLLFIMHASAGGQVVTGTAGICDGTWTLDTPETGIFMATSTATGSGSCTVTLTATSGTLDLMGVEIANSSGIDVRSSGTTSQGFHSANQAFNCPAVTTTVDKDLVLCLYYDSDINAGVPTAGSGFTIAVTGTTPTMGIESGIKTPAGAITPAYAGLSTGSTPHTGTIAYKP